MPIRHQVHDKFKIFIGALDADGGIGKLGREVQDFAAAAKAAPKSIGVEYLERSKRLVVTLGYRDDGAPYPVKLQTLSLGKADTLDAADLARLEKEMGEAASKVPNIICHELFVTEADEFVMVLMTHGAA